MGGVGEMFNIKSVLFSILFPMVVIFISMIIGSVVVYNNLVTSINCKDFCIWETFFIYFLCARG